MEDDLIQSNVTVIEMSVESVQTRSRLLSTFSTNNSQLEGDQYSILIVNLRAYVPLGAVLQNKIDHIFAIKSGPLTEALQLNVDKNIRGINLILEFPSRTPTQTPSFYSTEQQTVISAALLSASAGAAAAAAVSFFSEKIFDAFVSNIIPFSLRQVPPRLQLPVVVVVEVVKEVEPENPVCRLPKAKMM